MLLASCLLLVSVLVEVCWVLPALRVLTEDVRQQEVRRQQDESTGKAAMQQLHILQLQALRRAEELNRKLKEE